MSRGIRRITLAVAAGYITNRVLVAATELSLGAAGIGAPPYFVVDLIGQCLFAIVAGYLCCLIAEPTRRAAMAGLMGLGVFVGTISLVTSWKTEPHWYGLALLAVYPPCVWIGWALKSRARQPTL